MEEKQYIHLPKTGEHYQAPLGRICDCKGCFRTIPHQESQCVPCQQGYHGSPIGTHGYAEGKMQ